LSDGLNLLKPMAKRCELYDILGVAIPNDLLEKGDLGKDGITFRNHLNLLEGSKNANDVEHNGK
jgi:hypothetical protein